MKKVISIVLALLMMIPMAAMLVPTASAASTATNVDSCGTTGRVYYEQDFDDEALANLNDKELAKALGWAAPNNTATMWIEDGKVRIVSQYTTQGEYPVQSGYGWGGYDTGVIVKDDNLIRNTTVLEYKFTYNRRAASTAEVNNDIIITKSDGSGPKTIKADGQGGWQSAYFYYSGTASGSNNTLYRVRQSGTADSWKYFMKGYDTPENDKAPYDKTTTFEQVTPMAAGETFSLEHANDPVVGSSEPKSTSSIMNREYSMKIVVEPWAHRVYAFVDGQLHVTMNIPTNTVKYAVNDWGREIVNAIALCVKPGMDVTMDDIKLYEYVPNLTISEIMVNGAQANGTGMYQWIEITNPSAAPVNVYDYAIHLENMANTTNKPSYLIGCETDQGTSAWYVGAASTLGYFTPGAKTLGTEVFNSPSYEKGVLQPGESAIVLFPQTAMAGGKSVTDEAFNAYLENLGMPEGTKTFVVDNESDYNFTLGTLTGESVSVQIVKATNTATDGGYKPVADCKGQPAEYSPAFAECTAWATSKNVGSATAFWGLQVSVKDYNDSYNIPREALGSSAIFGTNTNKSYEIKYSGWVNHYAVQDLDFDHTNLKWGFSLYQPNDTRIGIDGTPVYATPGFVPVDCRRVTTIDVTDLNGETTNDVVVPMYTNYTVDTPLVKGYDTRVLVNGKVVVEKADAETTAVYINDFDTKIEVELYREGSAFIGYQTTAVDEDGYYDLRLLAAVNSFDYDALGFRVSFWDGGRNYSDELECEVLYVYTDVTATYADDSTENYNAQEDFKSNYLYALHIKGISIDDYSGMYASVEAIYMVDGEWQTGSVNVGDGEYFEIELD